MRQAEDAIFETMNMETSHALATMCLTPVYKSVHKDH